MNIKTNDFAMKILVSGAASGLGRYLLEKTGGMGLTRSSSLEEIKNVDQPYDMIMHCAFNMKRLESHETLNQYVEDSLCLTRTLTSVPHRFFVLMSTIDVYPLTGKVHYESEDINPNALSGLYPIFKLACESIVRNKCESFLILRPGMLLGPYMRSNNLTRLILGHSGKITLSKDSSYHCVLYEDILSVLKHARASALTGVYNLVRSDKVSLSAVAQHFAPETQFGDYTYAPDPISNEKISSIIPTFRSSSMDAIKQFISQNSTKKT